MLDLALKEVILVPKLLGFAFHLSLEAFVLELFHFYVFPELVDL